MSNESLISADAVMIRLELMPVEREIIDLTVAGYSGGELARRVGVTEAVLQSHLASIFDKLCVSNEFEMILCALHDQLVEPDECATRGSIERTGPRLEDYIPD